MKKILLTSLMSVSALGVHAQGTLNFTDYLASKGGFSTEIYSPSSATPSVPLNGNTSIDTPVGSTSYTGSVPLGGAAVNGTGANPTYQNGNDWTVQLEALGGQTTAVPLTSLLPVTQYTSKLSTSAAYAGQFNPGGLVVANDPGIPNAGGTSPTADIAVAAWYNGGGTITSLAQAQTTAGGIWGESAEVADFILTAPSSVTGNPPGFQNQIDTDSFRLTSTPEPSTIALGMMAAGAFIARRRKS